MRCGRPAYVWASNDLTGADRTGKRISLNVSSSRCSGERIAGRSPDCAGSVRTRESVLPASMDDHLADNVSHRQNHEYSKTENADSCLHQFIFLQSLNLIC